MSQAIVDVISDVRGHYDVPDGDQAPGVDDTEVRGVDHQVLLEADLRDPSSEGGRLRLAHHLHPGEAACGSGR